MMTSFTLGVDASLVRVSIEVCLNVVTTQYSCFISFATPFFITRFTEARQGLLSLWRSTSQICLVFIISGLKHHTP